MRKAMHPKREWEGGGERVWSSEGDKFNPAVHGAVSWAEGEYSRLVDCERKRGMVDRHYPRRGQAVIARKGGTRCHIASRGGFHFAPSEKKNLVFVYAMITILLVARPSFVQLLLYCCSSSSLYCCCCC